MKSLQIRILASLVALLFIVVATVSFAPAVDAKGGGFGMGGGRLQEFVELVLWSEQERLGQP